MHEWEGAQAAIEAARAGSDLALLSGAGSAVAPVVPLPSGPERITDEETVNRARAVVAGVFG